MSKKKFTQDIADILADDLALLESIEPGAVVRPALPDRTPPAEPQSTAPLPEAPAAVETPEPGAGDQEAVVPELTSAPEEFVSPVEMAPAPRVETSNPVSAAPLEVDVPSTPSIPSGPAGNEAPRPEVALPPAAPPPSGQAAAALETEPASLEPPDAIAAEPMAPAPREDRGASGGQPTLPFEEVQPRADVQPEPEAARPQEYEAATPVEELEPEPVAEVAPEPEPEPEPEPVAEVAAEPEPVVDPEPATAEAVETEPAAAWVEVVEAVEVAPAAPAAAVDAIATEVPVAAENAQPGTVAEVTVLPDVVPDEPAAEAKTAVGSAAVGAATGVSYEDSVTLLEIAPAEAGGITEVPLAGNRAASPPSPLPARRIGWNHPVARWTAYVLVVVALTFVFLWLLVDLFHVG